MENSTEHDSQRNYIMQELPSREKQERPWHSETGEDEEEWGEDRKIMGRKERS